MAANHPNLQNPHKSTRGQLLQLLRLVHQREGNDPKFHMPAWWWERLEADRKRAGAHPNSSNFKDGQSLATCLSILFSVGLVNRKDSGMKGSRYTYRASAKLMNTGLEQALALAQQKQNEYTGRAPKPKANGPLTVDMTVNVHLPGDTEVRQMTLDEACSLRDMLNQVLPKAS